MVKGKKEASEQKNKQLEEQLKRALADYDNLKKRNQEEKQAVVKLANTVLLVKFLEILDNLEAAQKNLNDQGLELVIKKFHDTLTAENVTEIEAEGKDFDPNLHEAISVIEGTDDGKVVQVLQKGYEIDGRVLRPARVQVSKRTVKVEGHD